eukprot:IDg15487t1
MIRRRRSFDGTCMRRRALKLWRFSETMEPLKLTQWRHSHLIMTTRTCIASPTRLQDCIEALWAFFHFEIPITWAPQFFSSSSAALTRMDLHNAAVQDALQLPMSRVESRLVADSD